MRAALREWTLQNDIYAPLYTWSLYLVAIAAATALLLLVFARRSRFPRTSVAVALLLIGIGVYAFAWRSGVPGRIGEERFAVLLARFDRPSDPWPRGDAHVPLGSIGAREADKAYLEPGCSMSPQPGSFGVSVWVVGPDGRLATSSDGIPLAETTSRYIATQDGAPGLSCVTPYYTARWTVAPGGGFDLDIEPAAGGNRSLEVALRGVGPSGGPLRDLAWRDGALVANDAWTVAPVARDRLTFMGREGGEGWMRRAGTPDVAVRDDRGWAHGRFAITGRQRITVRPLSPRDVPDTPPLQQSPVVTGLDPSFAASMDAQIHTLLQGLVGDETRPGDPVHYPLQWLRDGAYIIVALARAGQTDLARRLADRFAQDHFFGGFGSEADSPGLSLWALGELSMQLDDRRFDEAVWPLVAAKVAIIRQMLTATADIYHDYAGPIIPEYRARDDLRLVAGPARDGLVNGRMDWHRPVFFVNAVTYGGLRGAERIADRLDRRADAEAWGRIAGDLRAAWRSAFVDPRYDKDVPNERTAIAGLWPTQVAQRTEYGAFLEKRWSDSRRLRGRPLWTYFNIAEAHQWLYLDRPDRVSEELKRLWAIPHFPGLYTLWEGDSEDNSFGAWKGLRGWVQPRGVNPHYWSAAEVLLLQLNMLARVNERDDGSQEIVVGSGLTAADLASPVTVKGVGTSRGIVDWTWDGRRVNVTLRRPTPAVRLGPGFPPGTDVLVTIVPSRS